MCETNLVTLKKHRRMETYQAMLLPIRWVLSAAAAN